MQKQKKQEMFYFDDCAICRAMKAADEGGRSLGMTELQKVFKEQNAKSDAVGFSKDA